MFEANLPEHVIQSRTGHLSLKALRTYERVTEEQHSRSATGPEVRIFDYNLIATPTLRTSCKRAPHFSPFFLSIFSDQYLGTRFSSDHGTKNVLERSHRSC